MKPGLSLVRGHSGPHLPLWDSTQASVEVLPKLPSEKRVCLTRGIRAFKLSFASNIEETIERATEHLRREGLVRPGTPIVIVSDILSDHFAANSILLHHA